MVFPTAQSDISGLHVGCFQLIALQSQLMDSLHVAASGYTPAAFLTISVVCSLLPSGCHHLSAMLLWPRRHKEAEIFNSSKLQLTLKAVICFS